MPPKQAAKKGAAPTEEVDMSDIASLPKANVCLFHVSFGKFKSTEIRMKVQDHVQKHYPEERVKPLTRQEIIDYGKSKSIIQDGEGTLGLTQDQMLARSAADKIFEMTLAARGAKKMRQIKQQEEANEAAGEGKVPVKIETDEDFVDLLINMTDYPANRKEAIAFSQYGHCINTFYEVYQVVDKEGAMPIDLKTQKEVQPSKEEAEIEHLKKFNAKKAELMDAKFRCHNRAPVKNMAMFRVPYCDAELVELRKNEDGEPATNTLSAEQSFMKTFLHDYLELNAAYNLNFQRFMKKVDINQLMPEKEIMDELTRLKNANHQFSQWKADQEATIAEMKAHSLTDAQKDQMSQADKDAFAHQLQENIDQIHAEIKEQTEINRQNLERQAELKKMAKKSIDETRPAGYFQNKIYKNDFIPNPEVSNNVASIMSAMVSQIAFENQGSMMSNESGHNESTQPETLDDLFESYSREIAYDCGLAQREPEDEEFSQDKLKGVLSPKVDVYDTLDTSQQPILTLPHGMMDDHKSHAQQIANREREAASNFAVPGKNRNMMPPYPQKSKRLRDFENPQFYPFSTLPIEDAERTLQLKQIQRLIKAEKIDEQVPAKERLGKHKIFERKYDQYFTPDIMSQVLQDAFRQDPDVTASYYARTDSLLLVLHNKVNNSKRSSDNMDKCHGLKTWKSDPRVAPSFQNWLGFYQKNCIKNEEYKPRDPADAPFKYVFDAQVKVPESMIDIDEARIQNLETILSQWFPDDNSIMNCETYEIGGVKYKKSVVYKDKYSFGICQINKDSYLKAQKQHGLVSYHPIGEQQLWLNFSDNDTKLIIETIKAERNKQEMIEILPPQPTPEEIAAKEEAARAAAAAAAKGKKGGVVEAEPVKTERVEPVFKEKEPNFLDGLFDDNDVGESTIGPCINTTMKNGLIVRHMPNGDVVQLFDHSIFERTPKTEIDRVYMRGGIVIRHFANLDCEVLYPNGDFATFNRHTMTWVITNTKGFRRQYKDGVYSQLSRVNCLSQTDAKTGIVTTVREDNVVSIHYPEGNTYCQHADGTQIFSQEDGQQIRVEKDGFAPVMYQETENPEDSEEWLETEELKSLDGQMQFVFLPDGCVVKTIKFWKSSSNKDEQVLKHIFQRADYSCVIIDSDGDFRVISTNARSAINDEDERARLGTDTDYLKQMYKPVGEYTPGVFYGHVSHDHDRVHIITRDFERPYSYKINHCNQCEKHKYSQWQKNTEWDQIEPNLTFEPEREIELIGMSKNPFTKYFIYPRIFILQPEGDGVELLSQEQVDQVMKHTLNKEDVLTTSRVEYIDNTQLNSIQVMNKVTTLQEQQLANQKMSKLKFPEYAEPYVIQRRSEKELEDLKPLQDIYKITNISEYTSFEPLKQNAFIEDYMRFQEWKNSQIRYETEFGIVHVAPKDGSLDLDAIEDEEFYAKRINMKIYKERALLKPDVDRKMFKQNFINAYNTDEEVVSFRKKMTTVEKEEKEIKAAMEKKKEAEEEKKKKAYLREVEEEKAKERAQKKERTRKKVNKRLDEYKQKKETQLFSSHYHKSRAGIEYYKANPVQPPSQEVLMRMSQRINRSNQQKEEGDQKSQVGSNQPPQQMSHHQDNDNPIVALEPEEILHQTSVDKSRKNKSISQHMDPEEQQVDSQNELSLYAQEKLYLAQLEQEKILKAEEHHVIKTKDFNVYGKLRTEKPFVKSTLKSQVPKDLNEKFITTEAITDRRVKISSMATRQYINAPSVEEVRKQGQHQMILQAINKKQTFSELINQANSMVTSVLHDNLKRSVNILPSKCVFGQLKQGTENEMIVTIKNEDALSQRIQIKPTADKRIVVRQETYGPIAPGMTKRIFITIRLDATGSDVLKKVKEEVIIMTKSDLFKLPVEALILPPEEFEVKNQEAMNMQGKSIVNSRVRGKLAESLSMSKGNGIMKKFRESLSAEKQIKQKLTAKEGDDIDGDLGEYDNMDDMQM